MELCRERPSKPRARLARLAGRWCEIARTLRPRKGAASRPISGTESGLRGEAPTAALGSKIERQCRDLRARNIPHSAHCLSECLQDSGEQKWRCWNNAPGCAVNFLGHVLAAHAVSPSCLEPILLSQDLN